jgi:hypothetical protein
MQAGTAGLTFNKILRDLGAETKRQWAQGRAELANALFTGSAFVAYGEGQQSPKQPKEQGIEKPAMEQPQQENDGRDM